MTAFAVFVPLLSDGPGFHKNLNVIEYRLKKPHLRLICSAAESPHEGLFGVQVVLGFYPLSVLVESCLVFVAHFQPRGEIS
jgi:hypothetical protein